MKDYSWYKSYPAGIPREINPNEFDSLVNLLDKGLKEFADLPAFTNMGVIISFRQLDELSRDFAAYLQQKTNLKKGDRLAIQMPNLLQYPVVLLGTLRAGLTVVNVNPLYTPRELEHQLTDSGSRAIVVLANFASNLAQIKDKTQLETVIITEIGDLFGGLKKVITNFVVKRIKKMVPAFHIPQSLNFNAVMKQGKALEFKQPQLTHDDVAFLQYTGGTTGVAKGAILTQKNIIANVLQAEECFIGVNKGKDIVITALPLYHIFALTANCLLMILLGIKNVLITNPRDIPGFVKELNKYPFNIITGVNTLYNALLNNPEFRQLDFSSLRISIGGGMAVQKYVADEWEKVTGCPLVEGYGLSETAPLLCLNPLDGTHRNGTIGIPVCSTEIMIMDDSGNEVALGERGEICARGPQVMPGYWNKPEETKEVFFGEWFRTGDIGVMDEDGFTKIVDRKKDMILVSGFNVYPNEVEDAVALHEDVLEVAAIGVSDPKSTEAVKIFVVAKNPDLSKDQIKEHCKKHLTGYKIPKHIEFRDELPKTNVGKILRRKLKEEERAS